MSALRRFFNFWRRRSLDREFDDEIRFHFEMRIEANLRAGMTREANDRVSTMIAEQVAAYLSQ